MKRVGDACQLDLREALARMHLIGSSGGRSRISTVMQLQSPQEMQIMHNAIHGKGAITLDHTAAISISLEHVELGVYR